MEWRGGKYRGGPIKKKKCYVADVVFNKRRNAKYFYWGKTISKSTYPTEREAKEACEKWLYDTHKIHGQLKNEHRYINDKTMEVKLSHGKTMLIDREDERLIYERNWYARQVGKKYFAESGYKTVRRFHTLITGYRSAKHIDGDGLNNTRENIIESSKKEYIKSMNEKKMIYDIRKEILDYLHERIEYVKKIKE